MIRPGALAGLIGELQAREDARRDGEITLPDGAGLVVNGLDQVVWPGLRLSKGDLLRYYARVAPLILPTLADRPVGAKYYPRGLRGPGFFKQRAPATVPPGGRAATRRRLASDAAGYRRCPRRVGAGRAQDSRPPPR